jgi:hypothetical protein
MDNNIPFNSETTDEVSIDTCVENLTSTISGALEVSTPNSRQRADPRPPIPARIQDEIRLKNQLRRQWQLTRHPALKAEVNRLQGSFTLQLQEWRNDQWSDTLKAVHPEDQSLWRMTKGVMRATAPTLPLVTPGGFALSDSEKAEALADSLEAQFQPVVDPSGPAVIETVDVAFRAYSYESASKPMSTNPAEVHNAIRGLKISKAPGPDSTPNRALKHLPHRITLLLVALFNAILRTQYFPPVWKHARVISILKPGKGPALPSSYRPISLLGTIGKVFEKILLSRILSEVSRRGLLRDEQFGFRHKHSSSLQLALLVESFEEP